MTLLAMYRAASPTRILVSRFLQQDSLRLVSTEDIYKTVTPPLLDHHHSHTTITHHHHTLQ